MRYDKYSQHSIVLVTWTVNIPRRLQHLHSTEVYAEYLNISILDWIPPSSCISVFLHMHEN